MHRVGSLLPRPNHKINIPSGTMEIWLPVPINIVAVSPGKYDTDVPAVHVN